MGEVVGMHVLRGYYFDIALISRLVQAHGISSVELDEPQSDIYLDSVHDSIQMSDAW